MKTLLWAMLLQVGLLLAMSFGCSLASAQTLLASDRAAELVTDDVSRVFWIRPGVDESGVQWAVRRIQTAMPRTLRESSMFLGLALAAPYVLFFEGCELKRMYVSGRVTDTLASGVGAGLGHFRTLVAKGDYAYWSDDNGVHRVLLEGGAATLRGALSGWRSTIRTSIGPRAPSTIGRSGEHR
jgi:hypothetical protein